jgi:twinkle protein
LKDIPVVTRDRKWTSGWRVLDENLIVCPPELIVVTGKPNAGKSTFALAWMLNITRVYGVPGAVIQLEDNIERTRWEVNTYAKYWKDHKGRETQDPETGEIYNIPNYASDPDFADTYLRLVAPSNEEEDKRDLDWLRATIKEAALRHGCGWVLLDPLNELEHIFNRNQSEANYYNDMLRELKRIAREHQIALVIVTHPDKSGGRNEDIDEMTLYSISGGAAFKNKADHGIVIGREVDSNGPTGRTIVKVDKSKDHREMGIPGQKFLSYDRAKNLFSSST